MKNLLFVSTLTLTAMPSIALTFDSDLVIGNCIAENDTKKMQMYCAKQHVKALGTLAEFIKNGMTPARDKVFTECESDWVNDPKMQLRCTIDEFSILDRLNIK